jgi:hypothetical protein
MGASLLQYVFEVASVHSRQTVVRRASPHSLESTLICWHRPLSQLLQVLPRDFRQSWERLHKPAPSDVTTERNQPDLGPVIEKTVQWILAIQSTFLDTSLSTTAGHLPYTELELRCADTATSSSVGGATSGSSL